MSSIHERLTIAEIKSDDPEPGTDNTVTNRDGWLTFDAYVAWVAAMSGVPMTALSTPEAESERSLEDRRSTVIVPARRHTRRKVWPMRSGSVPATAPRRHRLSATVIRRALAKTG